nr:SpvB/TcaC N-terminal domain-containing protein [Treponema sp.]
MTKTNRFIASVVLVSFYAAQFPLWAESGRSVLPTAPLSMPARTVPASPGAEAEPALSASPFPAASPPGSAAAALVPAPMSSFVPISLPASRAARVSRRIASDKGGVLELGGVRLELPAGAVKADTIISIEGLSSTAPLDEGMSNVTTGAAGYRFEPRGIRFEKPVRITMSFDRSILGSETALSNLYTYFHDEEKGRWERLTRESVDRKAATITSLSMHFTDMINATLKLPEGPQPIQYDVNSIKNLQAANPGAALPMPEGPKPSAFGSNNFTIPLRLPPGRRGMSPELALRYSSDSSNSWLGKGFDLELPSITIDTRFGLPKYDGQDRYSLGGEELVPIGTDKDGSLLFEPRVEKSFQRIRWYRSSGAGNGDDYWQVTDKDGTVREYGHSADGAYLGPDRTNRSATFTWYLS